MWYAIHSSAFDTEDAVEPLVAYPVGRDAIHWIVFCLLADNNAKSLRQFVQARVNRLTQTCIEETRQPAFAIDKSRIKPLCQPSSGAANVGEGTGCIGICDLGCGNGRHVNRPNIELLPCKRTRKCFPGDVIPMRAGFAIGQDGEAVCQANGTEVIDPIVHNGSQTDSAIARPSEADQIRLAVQLSLGYMMECHLTRDKRTRRAPAGEDN
jgi:hypothetical protein